jgi:hypothetical protein
MRTVASLTRSALCAVAPVAFLAGCGGAQSPIGAPVAIPQKAAATPEFANAVAPGAKAKTLLLIAEQGPLAQDGLIEIYSAPFTGPPRRLHTSNTVGLVIAPNGDLIVANNGGVWVYNPPWTGKPRHIAWGYQAGILLFDSKARLFDVPGAGTINVFNPPYKSRSLEINGPSEVGSSALDSKNNLFLAAPPVSSKNRGIFECRAINNSFCKAFRNGGSVGIDQKDNLFTDLGNNVLGEFRPPYGWRDETASKTLPFTEASITSSAIGTIVVTGWDTTRVMYHLGVFLRSIKGPLKELPISQYSGAQFSIARNEDLFASDGTYLKPCVALHTYPYNNARYKCIATKYPVTALFAQ